jgi:DNA-binding MarR family transcriptional regulator
MTGSYWGAVPRWVAALGLTGRELRVLIVIASHARKPRSEPRPDGVIETRIARVSIERIADEANLDRRNVHRAIRQLEARGILERLRGGGRGRSSEYRVIFKRAADATNSVDDDAVSDGNSVTGDAVCDADNTGNSVVFGQETASFSDLNSVTDDAPTESEQKERTDPPSGESRAREGDRGFFDDGVDDEKQGVLLLPINGGGDRMAPLKRYNPSAELVDWAAELGVNALADGVLGEFIDYRLEYDKLPADIEAAYRRWVRREQRFAEQRDAERFQSRPRQRSNAAEAEAAFDVAFDDALRQSRANGAGND